MYYKIINQECEVFQKLKDLRLKELRIEEANKKVIQEKIGELTYELFWGIHGQQNFRRVTQYNGFIFKNPEKVNPKIWTPLKNNKEVYVPNKKTKIGREMYEFLMNGLQSSWYNDVISIMKVEELSRFKFPYVEIVNEVIIIYLGNYDTPSDKNVIEITSKEFHEISIELKA